MYDYLFSWKFGVLLIVKIIRVKLIGGKKGERPLDLLGQLQSLACGSLARQYMFLLSCAEVQICGVSQKKNQARNSTNVLCCKE